MTTTSASTGMIAEDVPLSRQPIAATTSPGPGHLGGRSNPVTAAACRVAAIDFT
jgi:hypothetical protein